MAYELSGKIKLIQDEKTFDSGFRKREIIVTVEEGKYPQDISIEFVQDKADLLNEYSPSQNVTITFDIRGREYNGRYFNNLNGWKIQAQGSEQNADTGAAANTFNEPASNAAHDFDDDIPF